MKASLGRCFAVTSHLHPIWGTVTHQTRNKNSPLLGRARRYVGCGRPEGAETRLKNASCVAAFVHFLGQFIERGGIAFKGSKQFELILRSVFTAHSQVHKG